MRRREVRGEGREDGPREWRMISGNQKIEIWRGWGNNFKFKKLKWMIRNEILRLMVNFQSS